jgi:hypothetical protein
LTFPAWIGYASALAGDLQRARTVLQELMLLSRERYIPPHNLALLHTGLGEDEAAIDWLERGCEVRDVLLPAFLTVDPSWDKLRGNPRVTLILKAMNLERSDDGSYNICS